MAVRGSEWAGEGWGKYSDSVRWESAEVATWKGWAVNSDGL